MHLNSSVQAWKPVYGQLAKFKPINGQPNPFAGSEDRFESRNNSLRFEGRVSQNPYLKGALAFLLGIGSVLSPMGSRIGRAHDGHSHDEVPPPREQVVRVEPMLVNIPVMPDTKRYDHIEGLYKSLPSLPKGSWERTQTEQRIQNSWNSLANDARNGNDSAKMALQALWVNRMYEELTDPSPSALRIDYPEYNELVTDLNSGKLDRQEFNTEVQWRALLGLYCYYRNGITDNPLTQNAARLYEPVTKLLESNSHPLIQSWGGSLLNNIFPKLSFSDQAIYLDNAGARYFTAPAGNQKLSAMKTLNWLNMDSVGNSYWNSFTPKVRTALKNLLEDKTQNKNEAIKYHLTLLGMLRDTESAPLLHKALSPEYSAETQGAAVWSLGRIRGNENLGKLVEVIHNPKMDLLVREHAIYSLAEYSGQNEFKVWEELNAFKSDDAKNKPASLKEAARAMRDMLTDRYTTEPDYYINKLLKNDSEKTQFRTLRDKYVTGLEKLNIGQKNMVDRALLPYRHFLQDVINQGGRHSIISGVVTDLPSYKNSFGKRIHDGRLNDTIEGMSSATAGAVTNKNRISPAVDNTFAHEFMHHIHQLVMNNDQLAWKVLKQRGLTQKIVDLYRKAVEEKRVLDYYGATNEYENLAQGGEAMDAQYRKHSQLYSAFFNRGYDSGSDNSRSKLKRQDPALYEFLEAIRCIPLEYSMNLLKAGAPEVYAQLAHPIPGKETRNVA